MGNGIISNPNCPNETVIVPLDKLRGLIKAETQLEIIRRMVLSSKISKLDYPDFLECVLGKKGENS